MHFEIHTRDNIFLRRNAAQSTIALWCLPGFADSAASFSRLFDTPLAEKAIMAAPDLPGFGASPRNHHKSTISEYAETLKQLIEQETPDAEIGLIGHSVGSVIAGETARLLGARCRGVFSIEGNVTAEDAYFSGRAAEFEDASEFKAFFSDRIWQRGIEDEILRAYYAGLSQADAGAMWDFGRDVKKYSEGDQPGHILRQLDCPAHYFWCPDNTPETTQKFIQDHALANTKVTGTSHWPMLDAPDQIADSALKFFDI